MACLHGVGRALDHIIVLLNANVPAITGNVYEGKWRISDSTNLENIIRASSEETTGWFIYWVGDATRQDSNTGKQTILIIKGILFYRMDANVTTTLSAPYELAESISATFMLASNWLTIGAKPNTSKWSESTDRLESNIGEIEFEVSLNVPC